MDSKRVLFVSQEIHPYLPENTISSTTLALAKKTNDSGHQVRVFMPRFGVINERRHQLHEVIRLSGMNVVINDMDMPLIIKVASVPGARMQVYFIDNEEYFKRKATYADADGNQFEDNDERTLFFSKGAIDTVEKLGWKPDVIHVHGWMSSLVPMYLRLVPKRKSLFSRMLKSYSQLTIMDLTAPWVQTYTLVCCSMRSHQNWWKDWRHRLVRTFNCLRLNTRMWLF
jgi:starch synthase